MTRTLRILGLVLTALAGTGCYEHVVRVEGGFGGSRETVYEPNLKEDRLPVVDDLEDAAFGKREPVKREPVKREPVKREPLQR